MNDLKRRKGKSTCNVQTDCTFYTRQSLSGVSPCSKSVFYFALQTGHLHESPQPHLPASQLHGLPCILPPHVCIFHRIVDFTVSDATPKNLEAPTCIDAKSSHSSCGCATHLATDAAGRASTIGALWRASAHAS